MCQTGTVRGQAKKNNVSIPRKTGKSTIVTHGTIRVNNKPWKVEYIVDTDGVGRNLKYLVKWLGWPEKFNSWISVTEYRKVK